MARRTEQQEEKQATAESERERGENHKPSYLLNETSAASASVAVAAADASVAETALEGLEARMPGRVAGGLWVPIRARPDDDDAAVTETLGGATAEGTLGSRALKDDAAADDDPGPVDPAAAGIMGRGVEGPEGLRPRGTLMRAGASTCAGA